jgi:hypothetical protein
LSAVAESKVATKTAESILGGEIVIHYFLEALVLSKLNLHSPNYVF